jgi:enoyl-CoA hydratase/carnithine racemase
MAVVAVVGIDRRAGDGSGRVWTITIERPERRNAVDGVAARALFDALKAFDADEMSRVAVLCGSAGANFCAGADLKAVAEGGDRSNPMSTPDTARMAENEDVGPMGISRLTLSKPVIAAGASFCSPFLPPPRPPFL